MSWLYFPFLFFFFFPPRHKLIESFRRDRQAAAAAAAAVAPPGTAARAERLERDTRCLCTLMALAVWHGSPQIHNPPCVSCLITM